MAKKTTTRRGRPSKTEEVFGAVINTLTGQVGLVSPNSDAFRAVATHLGAFGGPRTTTDEGLYFGTGRSNRNPSQSQRLTGTTLPSLRDRLLPAEDDLSAILDKTEYYQRRLPWLNRALVLRAALNAAEFGVDAPSKPKQTEWMLSIKRDLRMYSFMREFFIQLRSAGQVVPLWKTAP